MSTLPWVFVSLLLLSLPALPEAKRQAGEGKTDKPRQPPPSAAAPQPAKRPRNRTGPSSGEFTSKEGHRCSWETSGEAVLTLLVSCSTGAEQKYSCRYVGKPDLCPAYSTKSSQYWKQLVGKLKKRPNACEGVKVLKVKTCKKAPAEAHMKLSPRGAEDGAEAKRAGKGGGRKKGVSTGPPDGGKTEDKKGDEEEKTKMDELAGLGDDGMMNDMAPVQSYCAEGWHSVCSFFVRFFEG